jgi:hypothetical protein
MQMNQTLRAARAERAELIERQREVAVEIEKADRIIGILSGSEPSLPLSRRQRAGKKPDRFYRRVEDVLAAWVRDAEEPFEFSNREATRVVADRLNLRKGECPPGWVHDVIRAMTRRGDLLSRRVGGTDKRPQLVYRFPDDEPQSQPLEPQPQVNESREGLVLMTVRGGE